MKIRYIGMSSQPYKRKKQWAEERDIEKFRVLDKDKPLSYEEAQRKESRLLKENKHCRQCPHSEGHPGGRPNLDLDADYYVYTYLYKNR